MPIYRRVPKRGFTNARFRTDYTIINIDKLNAFEDGATVDLAAILEAGLASMNTELLKVLGNGELDQEDDRARPQVQRFGQAKDRSRWRHPGDPAPAKETWKRADEVQDPPEAKRPNSGEPTPQTIPDTRDQGARLAHPAVACVLPVGFPNPDPRHQPRVPEDDRGPGHHGDAVGVVRRRDWPDHGLRAGHHALHLGVDYLSRC